MMKWGLTLFGDLVRHDGIAYIEYVTKIFFVVLMIHSKTPSKIKIKFYVFWST